MTWLARYVTWHRAKRHTVVRNIPGGFLGNPITICWTCDMTWEPVWGTGDMIIRQRPKEKIDEVAMEQEGRAGN